MSKTNQNYFHVPSRLAEGSLASHHRGSIEWKSYIYGDYAFHYIVDQTSNLWFVCMAERALMRRVPFAFLQAVQETFMQKYTKEFPRDYSVGTQMHLPEWNTILADVLVLVECILCSLIPYVYVLYVHGSVQKQE